MIFFIKRKKKKKKKEKAIIGKVWLSGVVHFGGRGVLGVGSQLWREADTSGRSRAATGRLRLVTNEPVYGKLLSSTDADGGPQTRSVATRRGLACVRQCREFPGQAGVRQDGRA